MSHVTYEDAMVTEYSDGREEVRFTDAEWAQMMSDPAFGYVRSCGHRYALDTYGQPSGSDCMACEAGGWDEHRL